MPLGLQSLAAEPGEFSTWRLRIGVTAKRADRDCGNGWNEGWKQKHPHRGVLCAGCCAAPAEKYLQSARAYSSENRLT